MKFIRRSKYHEESDIGGYTVCAVGSEDGLTFEAWRGREQIAVRLKTAEEARAICVQHIEGKHEVSSDLSAVQL